MFLGNGRLLDIAECTNAHHAMCAIACGALIVSQIIQRTALNLLNAAISIKCCFPFLFELTCSKKSFCSFFCDLPNQDSEQGCYIMLVRKRIYNKWPSCISISPQR